MKQQLQVVQDALINEKKKVQLLRSLLEDTGIEISDEIIEEMTGYRSPTLYNISSSQHFENNPRLSDVVKERPPIVKDFTVTQERKQIDDPQDIRDRGITMYSNATDIVRGAGQGIASSADVSDAT